MFDVMIYNSTNKFSYLSCHKLHFIFSYNDSNIFLNKAL